MDKFDKIITNASYKDFFENNQKFNNIQYPIPSFKEYETLDNNNLIRALGLSFQKKDSNHQALYGLEIKIDGGSRSGRIPLVRVIKENLKPSIWKVSSKIEDLQKTVVALGKLVYFIEKYNDQKYPIPLKVIILRDREDYYATQDSPYYKFVHNLIEESGCVLFSLQFIKNLLTNNEPIDLNQYLQTGKIFIMTSNN